MLGVAAQEKGHSNEKDLDRATNLNLHEETIICESRLNKIGLFYLQYKKKRENTTEIFSYRKSCEKKENNLFLHG